MAGGVCGGGWCGVALRSPEWAQGARPDSEGYGAAHPRPQGRLHPHTAQGKTASSGGSVTIGAPTSAGHAWSWGWGALRRCVCARISEFELEWEEAGRLRRSV